MNRLTIFSILVIMLLSACSGGAASATPTQDPNAVATSVYATAAVMAAATGVAMHTATPTVTLTPTSIPLPSDTATIMPTPQPVDGVASANVTVRAEARKGADNVGGVFFNQGVKVLARNDVATWYYIVWPKAPSGTAWVLAKAITLKTGDVTTLPIAIYDSNHNIVILPAFTWSITGSPLPVGTPPPGAVSGTINQLAKVRVGPGLGYQDMGTLNIGTVVTITGRVADNSWLQIGYPSGPQGHGWISADLVQPGYTVGGLPFYNGLATPISDAEAKGGGSGGQATADPNSTAAPAITATPKPAGPTGVVIIASQINVHTGPASSFTTISMLNFGDPVVVTGETINNLWYRIVFPAGPDGYGWVSTKYIKITGGDMTRLPFFDNQGTPLPPP